jgi:hypothetical protein
MPCFRKPSSQRCIDFITRPDTFNLALPDGDIFYFSIPLDLKALHRMRSQELIAISDYLSFIRNDVRDRMGQHGEGSLSRAHSVIECWLANSLSLGPLERNAWHNGHGFPVFGNTGKVVDFEFDRNTIRFEGGPDLLEMYETEMAIQEKLNESTRTSIHDSEEPNQDEISVMHWDKNGHEAFEWRQNGETVESCVYGGHFKGFAEWQSFQDTLTDQELILLDDGVLVIRNIPYGGWKLELSSRNMRGHEGRHSDEQDSVRHRNRGELSPSVYDDRSHQEHEDTRLAFPNAYPCDETCCCTPPNINTPPEHTFPPPNTPTGGPRNPETAANPPTADLDDSIGFYGATFRNHNDWRQFCEGLSVYQLNLLSRGRAWLVGNSHTGIDMVSEPNAHLHPGHLAQAEADVISRHQNSTELDAMLRLATEALNDSVDSQPPPTVVSFRPTRPDGTSFRAHSIFLPHQSSIEHTRTSRARTVTGLQEAASKLFSPSQSTRRQVPQGQVFPLNSEAGRDFLQRPRALQAEFERHLALERNREQVARSAEAAHEQAPATNVGRRHASAPQAPTPRLSSETPRTSRHPRASQRASSAATNHAHNDVAASQSTTPPHQAYAEDSPEDSPRPSPNSWRDV